MVTTAILLLLVGWSLSFKTPELWDDSDFEFDGSGSGSEPTTPGLKWQYAILPTIMSVDFGIVIRLNLTKTAKWNGVFFYKNLTKIYEPLAQIGPIGRMRKQYNNIVLPGNLTVNPTITRTKTKHTLTDYLLVFRGNNNVNPFYGTGLYVNWTAANKVEGWGSPLYTYYFKKVDLGKTLLSQICLKDCYCPNNIGCE